MRFSKLFKLSSAHISAAFTQAQRVGSISGIKLMHLPIATENRFIIALAKQIKGSVQRNTIRRRIKASLMLILQEQPQLPQGIWLCVAYEHAINLSTLSIHQFLKAYICAKHTNTPS